MVNFIIMHFDQINFCLFIAFRINAQSRFPKFSKNYAYLFLHACLGDIPSTKRALLRYIQIRAVSPEIFDNRDIMLDDIQFVYDMT